MHLDETKLMFDFDQHYYEQRDAFTRYIDEEYGPRTVRFETGPRNENYLFVDGEPVADFPQWYPPLNARAGTDDFFGKLLQKEEQAAATSGAEDVAPPKPEYFATLPPAWATRDARLELMDEQGMDGALLLPTVALVWQEQVRQKPDLTCAIIRAFNRWLEDEWGYAFKDRLFASPIIALDDLDQAVDELERVIDKGARVINLHVAPVGRESPASTRFDPFWQRVEDAGVLVSFHLSASPYGQVCNAMWGDELVPPGRRLERQSPFYWATAFCDRPIMDMLASVIYWNLFGRFPRLQIASIENGADWVEYLLKRLDKMAILGRKGAWPGGKLEDRPSAIFKRHVSVVPFPEENIPRLAGVIGADRIPFGSDYPHPEGLPAPRNMLKRLEGLNDHEVDLIMGGNAARLLGLPETSFNRGTRTDSERE